MAKQDGYTRYTVRIPNNLYEALKQSAGEASVNAEIMRLLNAALAGKFNNIDDIADAIAARVLDGLKGGA